MSTELGISSFLSYCSLFVLLLSLLLLLLLLCQVPELSRSSLGEEPSHIVLVLLLRDVNKFVPLEILDVVILKVP